MFIIFKYFGTDGIRGIVYDFITPELAFKVGRAIGVVFKNQNKSTRIVVSKDTRESGDMLVFALCSGVMSAGCDTILVDILPTPAVSFLTRKYGAEAGVMISASHNAPEYNGIKIFSSSGKKLTESEQLSIENEIINPSVLKENGFGRIIDEKNAFLDYADFLDCLGESLEGLTICLDVAHGAAYRIAPYIFGRLGAKVITDNDTPNGKLINVECGATCPKRISTMVTENNADFGFAFDGDADRIICADKKGNILDGDTILYVFALDYLKKDKLLQRTVVGTVCSNLGMELSLKAHGIKLVRTAVGDENIIECLNANGYILGGEQAGHIIFNDYHGTGDGILAAVLLSGIAKAENKCMSALTQGLKHVPKKELNFRVTEKQKQEIAEHPALAELVRSATRYMRKGRVVARPSGTENLFRVLLECENLKKLKNTEKRFKEFLSKFSG